MPRCRRRCRMIRRGCWRLGDKMQLRFDRRQFPTSLPSFRVSGVAGRAPEGYSRFPDFDDQSEENAQWCQPPNKNA